MCPVCCASLQSGLLGHPTCVCVSSSQQKHTTGQLKVHLKPDVIHKVSYLKKSSDSVFHWRISLMPTDEGGPSLCLVASRFNTEWVQPGSLYGIQFQIIAGVMEGSVWSFVAPLQQVLKLKGVLPEDTGLHGQCPAGGWICEYWWIH